MNKKLIEVLKNKVLTRIELAALIFPDKAQPYQALTAVMHGKRELKECEIERIEELLSTRVRWNVTFTKDYQIFTNGFVMVKVEAIPDRNNQSKYVIFKRSEYIAEGSIDMSMGILEFFKYLNQRIKRV